MACYTSCRGLEYTHDITKTHTILLEAMATINDTKNAASTRRMLLSLDEMTNFSPKGMHVDVETWPILLSHIFLLHLNMSLCPVYLGATLINFSELPYKQIFVPFEV